MKKMILLILILSILTIPVALSAADEKTNAKSAAGRMVPKELRDRKGTVIGKFKETNGKQEIRNKAGNILGWYDPITNQTRDREGHIVGKGNLLTSLIRRE